MAETKVTPEKKTTKPKKAVTEKVPVKKTAAAKKTTATKSTAKPAAKKAKASTSDLESYYRSIEITAYFIAERDGFTGNPVDYWMEAEAKINK